MMMMMMMKLAVVLAAVATPLVVQAQQSNPCSGLSLNKCDDKTECTYISEFGGSCFETTGFKSVIRQGEDNIAPGQFCTVGGGKKNLNGGFLADSYSAIGGGNRNSIFGSTTTISGGNRNVVNAQPEPVDEETIGSTISGGLLNTIVGPFGVITGGGGAERDKGESKGDSNIIRSGRKNTISGGRTHRVRGEGSVVTGGRDNFISEFSNSDDTNCVITGGLANDASGNGSIVVGGIGNRATGDYSIAFGEQARAGFDSSMVVALVFAGDDDDSDEDSEDDKSDEEVVDSFGSDDDEDVAAASDKEGQFLVVAKSFRFQIGNGKNNNNGDISSTRITDKNIDRLIDALAEEE